eukprot:53908_1
MKNSVANHTQQNEEPKSNTNKCVCMSLHQFSPQDICDHIKEWILNDTNNKTDLAKKKTVFANKKLSGQKMIGLEPDQIKGLVKEALSPSFVTESTLDIMFNCYGQWQNRVQFPYEEISKKTAHEMAHIMFHY